MECGECLGIDVGPHVAELDIEDGDDAGATVAGMGRGRDGDADGLVGETGSDFVEGDLSAGKAGTDVGEEVASVEGVAAFGSGEPMTGTVDEMEGIDTELVGDAGEEAVVRTDEGMTGSGAEDDGEAVGADAGIDDADEDAVGGPEGGGLAEPERTVPDVERGDFVGEIELAKTGIDAVGHAFHGGDGTVAQTEVGEEDQGGIGGTSREWKRQEEKQDQTFNHGKANRRVGSERDVPAASRESIRNGLDGIEEGFPVVLIEAGNEVAEGAVVVGEELFLEGGFGEGPDEGLAATLDEFIPGQVELADGGHVFVGHVGIPHAGIVGGQTAGNAGAEEFGEVMLGIVGDVFEEEVADEVDFDEGDLRAELEEEILVGEDVVAVTEEERRSERGVREKQRRRERGVQ
jgi:hypothetical protein